MLYEAKENKQKSEIYINLTFLYLISYFYEVFTADFQLTVHYTVYGFRERRYECPLSFCL